MKLAIMQPYFLPYIGYWQLLEAVDAFIVYDNIQYTKKGWVNRNRFLQNGTDALFSIPLKQDSAFLDVCLRSIAADFDRDKLMNRLAASYRKAPCFGDAFPIVDSVVRNPAQNLFDYVYNSIRVGAEYLGIGTPIIISSTVPIDHSLRAEQKVISLCKALGADRYINAIGGQELYSKAECSEQGIELNFLKTRPIAYRQFGDAFVPNLSIIDVMMFNERRTIRAMLGEYDLV
jgi:hypothetical protein